MGAPVIATVVFDSKGSGVFVDTVQGQQDLIVATNRAGEFGRDAVGRQSPVLPPAAATFAGELSGVSAATGYGYTRVRAPAQASIFSPFTSLLGSVLEDAIPANLGLALTAREAANFDAYAGLESSDAALAARSRQVVALNLKLMAIAGVGTNDSGSVTNAIAIQPNLGSVRSQALAGPVDLNSASSMLAILNRSPRAALTNDAGRRAAAQLLARFGEAVDRYLTSSRRVGDIEHGLRLLVLPTLDPLFRRNAPTSAQLQAAESITVDDLLVFFTEISEIPPIPAATAKFVAVPDWRAIGGATRGIFPARCVSAASRVCNDVDLSVSGALNVQTIDVVAVRVPARHASHIAATLPCRPMGQSR